MRRPVAALLDPASVAVIGASNNPLKRGHQAISTLLTEGFAGPVYPVHPTETQVLGLPAYPTIGAVPGPVDLALIVTPAEALPDLLRACGDKGVTAAVAIAVGFGEAGEHGRALEEEAARAAAASGVCLVGPNTNGVLNLPAGLNLVGASGIPRGGLALLCQSGNMALSLFAGATSGHALGFSSYVGIGNEAGLRYHEVLDHLRQDPATEAVAIYAEGFRDGRALLRSAAELSTAKPIVCYKAGRSPVGQRSARSHTGTVAGSHRVAHAVLRQAGVTVVERSDDLLGVSEALLQQPPMAGRRVAVLTDGGGHGVVAADALDDLGLDLPELSEATRRWLTGLLPQAASTHNPVDVAGAADRDPGVLGRCLEAVLADPGVDGVLCVGLLGGYGLRFSDELARVEERAAQVMGELAAASAKPLVVHSAYVSAAPPAHELLRAADVPVHGSIESAARCLAALAQRGRFLASATQRSSLAGPRPRPDPPRPVTALTEPAGRELLARHGLSSGTWTLATDADAAAAAVAALDGPAALKVVSPDVPHKSEVGGVLLDVRTPEAARAGFVRLVQAVAAARPEARVDGVLVLAMATEGVELLVGLTTDPTFGPVLAVGAGGTAVEVLADTTFRAVPVTAHECTEMLAELAVAPLLEGFRGEAPIDHEALVRLLLAVSGLAEAAPQVTELDLNPVIAHPHGVALVDVRVVLAHDDQAVGGTPLRPDQTPRASPATELEASHTSAELPGR